ncbi:MAG: acyl-protein synthetase [Methylacidiphilales bacterium]|nr:acyl-protein synthetase [Candidatus Methylacidiphilales bacterium]
MPFDFASPAGRRAWRAQLLAPIDEAKWERLTRELFAWQFARMPAYRRICEAHSVTPKNLGSWREIPAGPQQLFKREKLFAHSSARPGAIYETSGTTTGEPGRQHLLFPDIYRDVSVEGARRAGLFQRHVQFHFLTPSPAEAPRSSLSAMFGFWPKAAKQSGNRFWIKRGKFDLPRLRGVLAEQVKKGQAVAICGTAYSFVHLLDAWADLPLALPPGSWLLETGGFKGRSREISQIELYAELSRTFAVGRDAIWNEYGMTELSSQAYARGVGGRHQTPPWARVLICDPVSGKEVPPDRRGIVRWIDLANVDSVLAVQTLDLAERKADGFRLLGRMARTEPRGCSLGIEDLLSVK